MSETLLGVDREKLVPIIACVVAVIGVILAFVMWASEQPEPPAEARTELVCPSCGETWSADIDQATECPSCGTPGGLMRTWYKCPHCEKVFMGSEVQVVSPANFRYRIVGSEAWTSIPPRQVTCPGCRRPFADLNATMLRDRADYPPAGGKNE